MHCRGPLLPAGTAHTGVAARQQPSRWQGCGGRDWVHQCGEELADASAQQEGHGRAGQVSWGAGQARQLYIVWTGLVQDWGSYLATPLPYLSACQQGHGPAGWGADQPASLCGDGIPYKGAYPTGARHVGWTRCLSLGRAPMACCKGLVPSGRRDKSNLDGLQDKWGSWASG